MNSRFPASVFHSPFQGKSTIALIIVLAIFLIPGVVNSTVPPENPPQGEPVRIAVRSHRGVEAGIQKWGATADALSRAIPGHTFEILPMVDFDEMRTAVGNGTIDFVITNPTAYTELNVEFRVSRMVTLINLRAGIGSPEYGGVVFTRADKEDIGNLRDIAGHSIMGVHPESFGGWWMVLRELKDLGIDPLSDCSEVLFSPDGKQDTVVREVMNGAVDIGTVRSGVIEGLIQRGELTAGALKILSPHDDKFLLMHSTRHYPDWPFAKLQQTPDALARQVGIALLSLTPDDPAAVAGNYVGWTTPLSYGLVHDLMRELRVGPYEEYGQVTLGQALRQHWTKVLTAVIAVLGLILIIAFIIPLNRRLQRAQSEILRHKDHLEHQVYERTKDLHLSRKLYHSVVEDMPVLICRFLPGGEISYVNQAYGEYFAKTPEELIGRPFQSLIPENEREAVMLRISALTVQSPLQSHDHQSIAPDGKIRWHRWINRGLFDDRGNVVSYQSFGEDITERKQAEEAHRVSEEKFRALYDNAPLSYQSLDDDGCFTDVNPAWLKTLGYARDEVIGKSYADFLHPDWKPRFEKNFPEFKRRGYVHDVQFKIRHQDGHYLDISFEGCIGYLPDGSFRQTYCVFQDITESKKIEQEREEQLHITSERVKELGCMYGVAEAISKLENLDQMFTDVVGLVPLGMQFPEITCCRIRLGEKEFNSQPFEDTEWRLSSDIVCRDEPHASIEAFLLEERPEQDFGPFLKEERELINGVARALGEAVERYSTELARQLLALAIEQASESVVIADLEGKIQYANPAFERVTGYSVAEAIGQSSRILKSGEHDDAFYKGIWEKISRGEIWSGRITNKKKDGSFFTEESTISPVFDPSGSAVNYVAVKRDVTEEIKLEEQFRQAQKMESVGQLAGGVAHDFNNMLGVILGHAEIILNQMDPSHPLHEDLTGINVAAQRSAELTRQLLGFARKQTIAPRVLDLNEAVEGTQKMLKRLIGEDIDLAWRPKMDIWSVQADPSQIDQILTNLCINARDAIAGVGKITIETGNVTFDENYCDDHVGFVTGEFVQLVVSDNGSGMDKEILDKLFEPFYTTKKPGEGTGLGLATVYGIVKQNRGFINAYSEPGKGTSFKVYLPRVLAEPDLEAKEDPAASAARGNETVLLVEDEPAILNLTQRLLEGRGYSVLAASSPVEALNLADNHTGDIHLLLTDVIMPEMSGKDLANNLRSFFPNLKNLFMSGYTANVIAHHGVLDEGVVFIQKPFTSNELAAKVQESLNGGLKVGCLLDGRYSGNNDDTRQ
ncbi:MAG: PAS domain S-box protein [Gemmatimonadales bacterium]|nr:PAS domain S-box protein [Gemmatimonadales bacterium]